MKILRALALVTCLGCSRAPERTAPSYEQVSSVMLRDVQGLWGGKSVYLKRDGATVVQVVTPPEKPYPQGGLHERRYQFNLGKEPADKIVGLLRKHDFRNIRIKDRPGVPDEGRPTVVVRFATGESSVAAKWSNDPHADFDAVYHELLGVTNSTPSLIPVRDGRYEEAWLPDGFAWPKPEPGGLK